MIKLQKLALVFTILGSIVWGLIGLFDFNLITYIFGTGTMLSRAIYILYGITALINIGLLIQNIEIK